MVATLLKILLSSILELIFRKLNNSNCQGRVWGGAIKSKQRGGAGFACKLFWRRQKNAPQKIILKSEK